MEQNMIIILIIIIIIIIIFISSKTINLWSMIIFGKTIKLSKPNQLGQIPIDDNGHGAESWRKKSIYNKFHTDHMVRL